MLKWICERVEGTGKAQKTAIGNLPTPDALDLTGLNLPAEDVKQLAGGGRRRLEEGNRGCGGELREIRQPPAEGVDRTTRRLEKTAGLSAVNSLHSIAEFAATS